MGWEQRGGRSYYYRKEREGAHVRSVYVGAGPRTLLVAQPEEEAWAERAQLRELCARDDEIDRHIEAACQFVEEQTKAVLARAGFHQHRGQWRRRREAQEQE